MSAQNWEEAFKLIRDHGGVILKRGLNDHEFQVAERIHGFRFPPDLRSFLAVHMPVGEGFYDWRKPKSNEFRSAFAWPFEGIAFDITKNEFWPAAWGERPASLDDAIEFARKIVEKAPRLVPLYSHRYIPSEPHEAGNPVFSVYQTDIIYYGTDLNDYFRHEFQPNSYKIPEGSPERPIRFWTDLLDARVNPTGWFLDA